MNSSLKGQCTLHTRELLPRWARESKAMVSNAMVSILVLAPPWSRAKDRYPEGGCPYAQKSQKSNNLAELAGLNMQHLLHVKQCNTTQ